MEKKIPNRNPHSKPHLLPNIASVKD
jgi:hypothetical protein